MHKQFKLAYLVVATITVASFIVAEYLNAYSIIVEVSQWILFPGLMFETIITSNAHASGRMTPFLIIIGAFLFWAFVVYLIKEIAIAISKMKKKD